MNSHYRSAIGQDSHRFVTEKEWLSHQNRQLMLGGIAMPDERPLAGNSDADVILHALTNAISGISGMNIIGAVSDRMCFEEKNTNSISYLNVALASLGEKKLIHVSISVEASQPRLTPYIPAIKAQIAKLVGLTPEDIGLTATSGEGLTAVGRGEGIAVICMVTAFCPGSSN
jgi:2-C-methyl-D-erythritol 2,4-cyclodiphosphate synthase